MFGIFLDLIELLFYLCWEKFTHWVMNFGAFVVVLSVDC